jgi:CRISPR-associated endoribonuclease Cas6
LVQAAFYGLLTPAVAEVVHDKGFPVGKRTMRLFVFSRLLGDYRMRPDRKYEVMEQRRSGGQRQIEFRGEIDLVVSSPLKTLVRDLANALVRHGFLRLGAEVLELRKVLLAEPKVTADRLLVRTLSPVTVYSTLYRKDGKPYALYFHPKEKEFERLVAQNLFRKYAAVHGQEAPYTMEAIRVWPQGRMQQNIVLYKKNVIKGYSGRFILEGPSELLQIGLDAGLGAKNSQGFGLVEMTN